uniref:Uncharacterized protein n=1 Tax=Anguilla anguilla TaxID=7936 RepID=A0A0E9WST3_ANGAN
MRLFNGHAVNGPSDFRFQPLAPEEGMCAISCGRGLLKDAVGHAKAANVRWEMAVDQFAMRNFIRIAKFIL